MPTADLRPNPSFMLRQRKILCSHIEIAMEDIDKIREVERLIQEANEDLQMAKDAKNKKEELMVRETLNVLMRKEERLMTGQQPLMHFIWMGFYLPCISYRAWVSCCPNSDRISTTASAFNKFRVVFSTTK